MAATKTIQVQDLARVQTIAGVLARHGFGQLLQLAGLGDQVASTEIGPSSKPTAPYARRLRHALVELGPTYVKLGQVLSVRPDILPKDVLTEFQSLQDRVDPMSAAEVREAVQRELERPVDEVFIDFAQEPLGAASIAQVHRACLRDGTEVAVKVQRPGIARTIRSDLHILYSLAALVEGRLRLPGMYTPAAIVAEFEAAITKELDFQQEAEAAARMRRNFKDDPDVVVPRIHPRWSTDKLLVMDLVVGRRLSGLLDAEASPEQARRLAHRLMDATYHQVFTHGFFHGDPHPGNLLITEDDRVAFLDFGLTGTLTGAMQDTLLSAFTSLVFRDPDALALAVHRAGATRGRVDLRAFRNELERLMVKYYGASLDALKDPATLMEVVELSGRFRIDLPPEFAVLSRAIGIIEGILNDLLPGLDIVEEVRPYAQRLIAQRFSPERITADAARATLQLQGHLKAVPIQVNQALMDLEGGRLTFRTIDPDAPRLREELRMAVLRLSLAMLASTVTLGSLMFLAVWSPTLFGVPIFGVLAIFTLGFGTALFGFLGVHVLFARYLDLNSWRRRAMTVLRFFSWRRD